MNINLNLIYGLIVTISIVNCNAQIDSQEQNLSNDFDKEQPIYYGMPDKVLSSDTSPGWKLNGQKIILTGTVYQHDSKTPANDVLLYYYQTNLQGKYVHKSDEKRTMPPNKLGQTHGYIRGWVKTDAEGKYTIKTVRPGSYPNRNEPGHIHVIVDETGKDGYYFIDDFVFDDDKLLNSPKRKTMENRGGSGVLRLVMKDGIHIGERNIILGLNIPNYPGTDSVQHNHFLNSGKNIGEDILSFTPFHAWGPDRGSKVCPICKYGWYHGILYFVGDHPNWEEIKKWLIFLEKESLTRKDYLKVYFVYGNDSSDILEKLEILGKKLTLKKIALTCVPSFTDVKSEMHLNKINPEVENTFLLYRRSNIIDKFINIKPSTENFELISQSLDQTINEFFDLPRPKLD